MEETYELGKVATDSEKDLKLSIQVPVLKETFVQCKTKKLTYVPTSSDSDSGSCVQTRVKSYDYKAEFFDKLVQNAQYLGLEQTPWDKTLTYHTLVQNQSQEVS